ncbi:hypothetical protein D3C75_1183210 [compost metagenome]
MAVEAKELIVQALDQRQPQLGERLGRHPRLRLIKQLRGDAHRTQLGITLGGRVAQGVEHGIEEVHGD